MTCRYVENWGYHLRSHAPNCDAASGECDGCQPCETDEHGNRTKHCTARRFCASHLDAAHPLTCPACIGRTRDDLALIVKLSGQLLAEAIEAGVASEAANLAGPAPHPVIAHWQRINTLRANPGANPDDILPPDDRHHPLTVLGMWEMLLREDYGHETAERVTIVKAAAYLDGLLTRLAQDDEQDWPLFASEVRACRAHLEDVLHTAKRPQTGAPCPACEKAPPLERIFFRHWHTEDTDPANCAGCSCDAWKCPACKATWYDHEYRKWVADDYLENAEALTAAEMQQVHGIKPATLRKWAERDQRIRRGRNPRGQQTYDVELALARHQSERIGA